MGLKLQSSNTFPYILEIALAFTFRDFYHSMSGFKEDSLGRRSKVCEIIFEYWNIQQHFSLQGIDLGTSKFW